MKIKNKLLLIFILFLGIILLNNFNKSYALTREDVDLSFLNNLTFYSINDVPKDIKGYDYFIEKLTYFVRNYHWIELLVLEEKQTGNILVFSFGKGGSTVTGSPTFPFLFAPLNVGDTNYILGNTSFWGDDVNGGLCVSGRNNYYIKLVPSQDGYSVLSSGQGRYELPSSFLEDYDVLYCSSAILGHDKRFSTNVNINEVYFVYSGNYEQPTNEFQKMFELNLIDKNFNDTKHTFTLKANKEDIRYNELMELINNENNYCIYLTDYTRLLTYENKRLDCPLKSRLVFNVTAT